jgi:guanine deaminase
MKKQDFILSGDICYSRDPNSLEMRKGAFLVCTGGKSRGVFDKIPGEYHNLPLIDYTGNIIVPGLTDLHIHAPQFAFRSLGMDLELLDWLEKHAFPEEAKYANLTYAETAYRAFIENLKTGPNTRICVFATIHVPATLLLMEMLEESGLACFVGKVNMDRNSPSYLTESESEKSTREWLQKYETKNTAGTFKNVRPILTPRFIPSCTDNLMKELSQIQREYNERGIVIPLQSHLSENKKEIEWVRELCPESSGYADAYDRRFLLNNPTIMAHCVWSDDAEIDLLIRRGIFIAHCPQSNTNLSSGIAPVRKFIRSGVPLGLGSDVAGGVHTSIFRAMADAIQVSKLRYALAGTDKENSDEKPITVEEAFYLGTAGGGAFFGKLAGGNAVSGSAEDSPGAAGSFENGYDFDALIIDDTNIASPQALSLRDRLERIIYLSDERNIKAKYVRGTPIKTS